MAITLVDDIYGLIESLVKFPFPQICVHSVALDLLNLLEKHGESINENLIRAVTQASNGYEEAAFILQERREGNG